jgi:hypothetical protein
MSALSEPRSDARWSARPRPPAPVRVFNRAVGWWPRRPTTAGEIIDRARRETGLRDLGDPFFVPALSQLLESMHRQAQLTPVGRFIQERRLTDLLKNRLRIEEAFARRPELQDVELLPVVLIAGLQRTGTTLLHRLLAAHPRARSLASWEALNPAPLPGVLEDYRRRALARRAELALRFLSPEFFAIHPVQADAPEEDVLLLELSFMSQTSEAIMNVPSYARWLERQDQSPAYAYMVRVLKLLQGTATSKRHWVLKSPHHLEWLDVVLRELPDARIVQTHRDPRVTVPSFCSMVAHGRAVFSDAVDARAVGRHWLAKTARLIERSTEVRRHHPEVFVDLEYEELVADPHRAVTDLCALVGWSIGPHLAASLRAELGRSRKDRFGRHHYELADYDLDEESVRAVLRRYMERHGY